MYVLDKQTEDQSKNPSAVAIVDSSLQEVVQQEVERPVEGSAAFAQEILGCHSSLVVSDFLCSSSCFVEYSVLTLFC